MFGFSHKWARQRLPWSSSLKLGRNAPKLARISAAAMLPLWLCAPQAGAQTQGTGVVTFHNGGTREGAYVVPGLTWTSAANLHRDTGFAGQVNGAVYAQPLYWLPTGAQSGQVIVATETNNVYALDAQTGAVTWHTALGTPVPKSALPCGNIDPVGVTGTPIIDASAGAVYMEAAVLQGSVVKRKVFGLSLADGAVLPGWPVDIQQGLAALGVSFDPTVQNQRSALSLHAGQVFVAYGGNAGDCGNYHGFVVGVRTVVPDVWNVWQARATKGGIWAPGGIVAADGEMYVTTGNSSGATTWADGVAVIRLTTDLHHSSNSADYFTPSNWASLDQNDKDLGGTNPVPFKIGSTKLIMALGKDGNAYLLNRMNLGGIGAQIAMAPVSSRPIVTEPASYPGAGGMLVAVPTQGGLACPANAQGLDVLLATTTSVRTAWCAAVRGAGAPITTTTDGTNNRIVWMTGAGAGGDNLLHGFRGDTGAPVFTGGGPSDGMSGLHYFGTILAAQGRLYMAGDNQVYAFTLP